MKRLTLTILSDIDKSIKVGDIVRLWDGSSIGIDNHKPVYIINAYPELTGSEEILKNLDAIVVQTNIKDKVHYDSVMAGLSNPIVFLQDIIIKIGNTEFRTASNMVRKVTYKSKL